MTAPISTCMIDEQTKKVVYNTYLYIYCMNCQLVCLDFHFAEAPLKQTKGYDSKTISEARE